MFLKRNQLYKRKIVGGNLLGNLFNKSKKVFYNTAKTMLPQVKGMAKMTSQKALKTLKEQITPDKVFDLAKDLAKKDTASVKRKLRGEVKQLVKTLGKDKELQPVSEMLSIR